jgi:hypothetical protein
VPKIIHNPNDGSHHEIEPQKLAFAPARIADQAQAAMAFYKNEMLRNPGNATAAARVKLMEHILSLLD